MTAFRTILGLVAALAFGLGAAQTESGRRLAPGDTIVVACPASARYCVRRTLTPAGEVVLPGLPPIAMSGLTPEEAGRRIAQWIEREAEIPEADVTVRQVEGHTLTVSIGGMVAHPEVRFLSPGMTLPELVTEAGPAPGADPNRVLVTDVRGRVYAVDAQRNPWLLRPGDAIELVGRTAHPEIFVLGGVEAPGAIPYETDMTVAQAVTRAGGISGAGKSGGWRIAHVGQRPVVIPDTPDATGIKLSPGDVVEVPLSEPITAFTVIGAVVTPSRVEFRKGTHLSAVLRAAGGLRADAQRDKIQIRSPDGTLTSPGGADPILRSGDWVLVPSAG